MTALIVEKQYKKADKMKRMACIIFCALLLLNGCVFDHISGTFLAVEYPSGFVRDCYSWNKMTSIEGTALQLQTVKASGFEKTRKYDVEVLDESGTVLYRYPKAGYSGGILRGSINEDGDIWISSENWNTPHYNGYINGNLEVSHIFLIDMQDGGILFQQDLEQNVLYLTSVGTKCYFYDCGKQSEEKLFGLYQKPQQNAEIYYREMENWDEKVSVHMFDYAMEPKKFHEESCQDFIKFCISENKMVVLMNSKLLTNQDTNTWEYAEQSRIEIPFE